MPSRSMLIAMLALFAALAGTATAAKLINGKTIKKGTVTARQVKDRSLGARELSPAAIRALRVRQGRVTGSQIVDGTVTQADLAPASVSGSQVIDRSLTAGDLVAETVTSTELGVGSVGDSELAGNSVGNAEIKGQAISRNQLRPAVLRVGTVPADFGDVAADSCKQLTVIGATYAIPTGAFAGAAILVGAPAALPDGVVVDGRSPDGDNLRLQVCNPTNATVTVGAQTFPFTAFGTS